MRRADARPELVSSASSPTVYTNSHQRSILQCVHCTPSAVPTWIALHNRPWGGTSAFVPKGNVLHKSPQSPMIASLLCFALLADVGAMPS